MGICGSICAGPSVREASGAAPSVPRSSPAWWADLPQVNDVNLLVNWKGDEEALSVKAFNGLMGAHFFSRMNTYVDHLDSLESEQRGHAITRKVRIIWLEQLYEKLLRKRGVLKRQLPDKDKEKLSQQNPLLARRKKSFASFPRIPGDMEVGDYVVKCEADALLPALLKDAEKYNKVYATRLKMDPALLSLQKWSKDVCTQGPKPLQDLPQPSQVLYVFKQIHIATEADCQYSLEVEARPLLALLRSGEKAFPVFEEVVQRLWSAEGSGAVGNCLVGAKKLPRVAQKLASNYFDLAYVTDLVRGTIRYETVGHLLAAGRRLAAMAGVEIVRVKNRLDPSYDATAGGGYRDLLVNVRVAGHICELQLQIEAMFKLKTGEGHKHYVQYRNATFT